MARADETEEVAGPSGVRPSSSQDTRKEKPAPHDTSLPQGRPGNGRPAPNGQPAPNGKPAAQNVPQGPAGAAAEPQKPEPEVGDPPRLAPDVNLAGELEDTGYAKQQWLAERGGAFVQVTELLYRALEQVDGTRSIEDIGKGLSEKMNRPYTADNARRLLQKLVPLGLVLDAQGNAAPPPEGASALRGPLAVNLKMALIPPEVANAIVKPFTIFFFPPVIAVLLLAALAGHLWLYLVHGVARGTSQVIYNPGLILAIIAAIVLAAAFHEIGHGAGLRYGGGKVRQMGVGVYLVYPVFYTDITSSYSLGKGARLRADLGGFYFNVIFQLVALGLFALTGQEFFLVVIMLLDIEILYQMLPFVRMDGYWILADLTGIPDFFTRMGATLRGLLPGAKKTEMPPLKPTARIVFILYTIVVVPLLALLIFGAFRSFPSVVATVADSSVKLMTTFNDSRAGGDTLGAVSAIVQIALLLLQAFGLAMVIFMIARRALTALWRWGQGSMGRRAVSSLGTTAALIALVLLWLPANPLAGGAPGALYNVASAGTVIPPTARGNLGDIFTPLAPIADSFEAPPAPSAAPSPSPSGSPSITPSASPSAAPTASSAPTASTPPAPASTFTPVTTPVPTAVPTAPPPASPVPTATP
jgi:putative peptide zinc metalloprotease protein